METRPEKVTHYVWGGARTPHMPTYCGALVASQRELSPEPTCLECLTWQFHEEKYLMYLNVHDELSAP